MYYAAIAQSLGGLSLFAGAAGLGLIVGLALPRTRRTIATTLAGAPRHPLAWAWATATAAMLGSLYFSSGAGFTPCVLCWYQRIAMYPLTVILAVALWRNDGAVWRYTLPLAGIGLTVSAYHVVLQAVPTVELAACTVGAPCSARYVAVFGFISIPVMAGSAFLLITGLLLTARLTTLAPPNEPPAPTP